MEHPFTYQSLFHSFRDRIDPYYEVDRDRPHKGVGRPAFNVSETEAAFLLDGEVPGVYNKAQITVEWLQNQVLTIRGVIEPSDTETMKDAFKEGLHNDLVAPKRK
jgi:HSP20 family molecular chaperone IbpA